MLLFLMEKYFLNGKFNNKIINKLLVVIKKDLFYKLFTIKLVTMFNIL